MAARQPSESDGSGRPLDAPLTLQMPRQPGSREARYVHLLGDHVPLAAATTVETPAAPQQSRIEELHAEIDLLKNQISTLVNRIQVLEERDRLAVG